MEIKDSNQDKIRKMGTNRARVRNLARDPNLAKVPNRAKGPNRAKVPNRARDLNLVRETSPARVRNQVNRANHHNLRNPLNHLKAKITNLAKTTSLETVHNLDKILKPKMKAQVVICIFAFYAGLTSQLKARPCGVSTKCLCKVIQSTI